MKRRQKRVLQMAFVFTVALIFLPNVGLWSLYRDKHLMKSHEVGEQVGPAKNLSTPPKGRKVEVFLNESGSYLQSS